MKKAPEEVAVVPFGRFISSYITRSLADANHAPALVDKLHMHDAPTSWSNAYWGVESQG